MQLRGGGSRAGMGEAGCEDGMVEGVVESEEVERIKATRVART